MKKLIAVLVVVLAFAGATAKVGNTWHAADAQATAKCNVQTGIYEVTATITQSGEWPGAFVKSVTPTTYAGATTGDQTVKIIVGWPDSQETQTFYRKVTLEGNCRVLCEPTTVERIVYVDRPIEVVREVEKVVEKPVIRVVTKTVVKWKTRVVTKWKTRTVVKRIIITKVVHDRCPPPPTCCVGKG